MFVSLMVVDKGVSTLLYNINCEKGLSQGVCSRSKVTNLHRKYFKMFYGFKTQLIWDSMHFPWLP